MTHVPVLFNEAIDALDLGPGDFIIDGTVDGGGHSEGILERIGGEGRLLGVDLDPQLLEKCRQRIGGHSNVVLAAGNYADLPEILSKKELPKANALLLDLGFSSEQVDLPGKGLSFLRDEPLTLTYDPAETPFYETLRHLKEAEIAEILFALGEERYAKKIAAAIYGRERKQPILRTAELAEIVAAAVPPSYERGRLHPATRTFQAFRIYANDELGNLRRLLENLEKILLPGARLAIISFHSLEDRVVKTVFRERAAAGTLKLLNKKPITASPTEISKNPRARSAKLRAAILQ